MKKWVFLTKLWLCCLISQAQITLVNPAAEGGFEVGATFALNGWTVVNGTQTNQWHVGTAAFFAGSRGAYISNNSGTSNNYDVSATSVVHFYRDITIPAYTTINLSFRWRGQGEGGYDYLRVYIVPTTTTPIAGTLLGTGQVGGNFHLQGTWQLATLNGIICNNTATPITRRLVFSWRNDNSIGTQPPAAVDNISVVANPIPPCNLGTGVTNVATLPYSSGAGTTCGAVNDLTSSNTVACGSTDYLGGEDRVWVFTPTTSGQITINLTSSGSWTGLMLYNGCPATSCSTSPAGTCIAQTQSDTGNKTICFNAVAGTTYYLVLDSWPAPNCNPYTNLTISAPVLGCSLGTGVTNVSALPYASGPGTTCGAVNDITIDGNGCGSSSYLGGEDRVWVFTPTTSGDININLVAPSASYTSLKLYNSCPILCGSTCIANTESSSGDKILCASVTAGTTYYLVLDSQPAPDCNAYENLIISVPVTPTSMCNLNSTYSVSSIAFNPDVLTTPNLSGFADDIFYPGGTISTGFDFCLGGVQYQTFLISANGYVIFPTPICSVTNLPTTNAAPGGWSGWSITANLPNTTNAPRNAILAPWHDIDPSITSGGATPRIRYQVFGTAPNRRFVVSWETVPMYSPSAGPHCNADRSLDFTGQIKMFETTNNIEIHLTQKRVCATWNSGIALLGIHNYNGTQAVVPSPAATYNNISTTWPATNEAWRFTFNPTSCTTCTPLPLNLLYFNGEFDKEKIQSILTWSFKTPTDAAYFVVERSQDEVNFEAIGKVDFSASNSYRFVDEKPLRHTNIYRLKKVDKSGKTEYSHHVRVYNPVRENWAVERIYPNPTQNLTNIDLVALFQEKYAIKMFNLQGIQVFEQTGEINKGFNQIEVKFGNLPKGTYLLLLTTPTQMYQHKLVVE